MSEFKQYRVKMNVEIRKVTPVEIELGLIELLDRGIEVDVENQDNGSPKKGDMIVKSDFNTGGWLVTNQYFNDNYELIK